MKAEKYYQNGKARNKNGLPEDGQSLQDLYPEIAKEFVKAVDPKEQNLRPKDYKPGSSSRAYFKCSKCGAIWSQIIQNRTRDKGNCPNCKEQSVYKMSFPEVFIYNELKQMDPQIKKQVPLGKGQIQFDMYLPDKNLYIEYGSQFYHEGRWTDSEKVKYCRENGLKVFWIFQTEDRNGDIQFLNNGVLLPKKSIPDNLEYLNKVVEYLANKLNLDYSLCDHQKSFEDAYIKTRKPMDMFETFAYEHPELAKEWDYEKNGIMKPEHFKQGSHVKVWWKCSDCGTEWQDEIGHRVYFSRNKCPGCGKLSNNVTR